MPTGVNPGNPETFTSAEDGRTDNNKILGEIPRGISSELHAQVEVDHNRAESASQAWGGDYSRWRLAEVWVALTMDGDTETLAETVIDGEYKGTMDVVHFPFAGDASARVRLTAFIYDAGNSEDKDEVELVDNSGKDYDWWDKHETFTAKNHLYLKPGHTYRVGVRTETWATGVAVGQATADVYGAGEPDGNNGRISFESIDLNWP